MYSNILVVFALSAVAHSHDILKGSNNTEAKKMFDEHFEASPAIWKQTKDLFINASEHEVISQINITDLRPDKDGEAEIVAGGVGQNNVTITLKSPTILRGYDFLVTVYSIIDENGTVTRDADADFNSHRPGQGVNVIPVQIPEVPEEKISTKVPSDVAGKPDLFTTESRPAIVTGLPSEVTGTPVTETTYTPAERVTSSSSTGKPKTKELSEPAVTEDPEVTPEETPISVDEQEVPKMQPFASHSSGRMSDEHSSSLF